MPSEVAYSTVTVSVPASSSVTVNAMELSAPSVPLAPSMLTVVVVSTAADVPATVADGLLLNLRPSSVQIAPEELQFVVAGSVIVRESVPAGRTLMFHPRSLPCVLRHTRLMLPPLTWNASCTLRQPAASSSVNVRSNVKSAPVCSSGTFEKLAVSGVSLFRIVPVASASARSAPEALLRVSVRVSPPSSTVSSVIGTETVFVVSPDWKVSVPLVAV